VGDALTGRDLPVPLHEFAKSRNIQRLRFEPLLSTAGLAKSQDGFEIYLNTEGPGVDQKAGTVLDAGDDNWSGLATPSRFSVAHEIAHLIFKETAEEGSQSDFFRENADKLEVACNEIARMLLIPKQLLIREVGDRLFDASHLGRLLTTFRVSAEVIVRRFRLADLKSVFGNVSGLIALAREDEKAIRIVDSHSFGHLALERFGSALGRSGGRLEGCAIQDLRLHSDVDRWLRQEEKGSQEIRVPWRTDAPERLPCELSFHRICRVPLVLLIGVKIAGVPEANA